jgi:hypothetical protein
MRATCSDGRHTILEAHYSYRYGAASLGAIAELTRNVVAPALHTASNRESARVQLARGYRGDAIRQSCHIYRCRRTADISVVAELPLAVIAPALYAAGNGESARVVQAGSNRAHTRHEF